MVRISTEEDSLVRTWVVGHGSERTKGRRLHRDRELPRPRRSIKGPGIIAKMIQIQLIGFYRATTRWAGLPAKQYRLMMLHIIGNAGGKSSSWRGSSVGNLGPTSTLVDPGICHKTRASKPA